MLCVLQRAIVEMLPGRDRVQSGEFGDVIERNQLIKLRTIQERWGTQRETCP